MHLFIWPVCPLVLGSDMFIFIFCFYLSSFDLIFLVWLMSFISKLFSDSFSEKNFYICFWYEKRIALWSMSYKLEFIEPKWYSIMASSLQLDLIVHSLYSHKEVFHWELVRFVFLTSFIIFYVLCYACDLKVVWLAVRECIATMTIIC